MRLFEICISVSALYLFLILLVKKPNKLSILFGISINVFFVMLHGIFDGFRIIMLPAYLLSAIIIIASIYKLLLNTNFRIKNSLIKIISFIYALACIMLPIALPVFSMPDPSGSFGIGTISMDFLDTSRKENYTKSPGDFRKLMAQLWYPIDKGRGKITYEPYPKEIMNTLETVFGLPTWIFNYLSKIPTHTVKNAAISNKQSQYPVILFSPGYRSTRFQNMALIEELVSNGYIVVGIDHSYISSKINFNDGSKAAPEKTLTKKLKEKKFYEYEIEVCSDDASFILSQLISLNTYDSKHKLANKLDLANTGFLGHSHGGGTVIEALAKDKRFKAGLSLEGIVLDNAANKSISQPFMYLQSSKTIEATSNKRINSYIIHLARNSLSNLRKIHNKSTADFYYLIMDGYNHNSFTDMPMICPILFLKNKPIETTNVYVLSFFNKYLKQKDSDFINDPSKEYPYVKFQRGINIKFPGIK